MKAVITIAVIVVAGVIFTLLPDRNTNEKEDDDFDPLGGGKERKKWN